MKYKVSVVIPTKNRFEKLNNCLESVYASTLKDIEIIVIDDGSDVDVKNNVKEMHGKKITFFENKKSLGVGVNRTFGAKKSNAKYVLFVDDDNVIAKDMIEKLYTSMETYDNMCIVMPAMYFKESKKTLFYSGIQTSLTTSYLKILPIEETMEHPYQDIGINTAPNVFMVRKEQGEKIGWFDAYLIGVYTDLDYYLKLKKREKDCFIAINPEAKCWHDTPLLIRGYRDDTYKNINRMYLLGRNRGVIMKRYATPLNLIIFACCFYPLFTLFYSYNIIKNGTKEALVAFYKGTIEGYGYIIT